MGPDEVHLWVLRELVDEVAKPLATVRSCGSSVKLPLTGKRET